ncbi:ATP synthase A chain [Cutibacterium acnes JCM 18916]|nr:ATP synthase A chain [Cutibacterium acnes JCM 18916]
MSWFVYVIAGFKTKGIRYLKDSVLPPGVPWYLRWLIIPLEFLSNFVTRPLTLSLRLFANMVAGHLIIMIFVVGGGFLLTYPSSIIYNVAGGLSLILSFALFALELFVGFFAGLRIYRAVGSVCSILDVRGTLTTHHL